MSEDLAPIEYKTESGNEITLSPDDVKSYLTKGNGHVTDAELLIYMNQCKSYRLDPFATDVYLVKYSDDQPAAVILGKDAFLKRADNNPAYDGMESGVLYASNGELHTRKGAFIIKGETLLGAWANVYRNDRTHPTHVEVSFAEYNTGKSSWKSKPATMIVKCAKAQALREAFPNLFSGLYEDSEIPENVVENPESGVVENPKPTGNGAEIIDISDISAPATPEKQREFGEKLTEAKKKNVSVSSIKAWCKEEYGHEITELNDAEITDAMEYIDAIMKKDAALVAEDDKARGGESSADEGNVGGAASYELLDEDIGF